MRAARFHAYGAPAEMRVDEIATPEPGADEVLIRVRAAAINHWDVDMRKGTSRLPLTLPHTPGIEVAGEVAELGSGVAGIAPGTRVMPRFLMPCRECEWCAAGEDNNCARVRVLGATEPGGYAEYVVVPAWSLIRIPEQVSFQAAAALQGTFAPVLHALKDRLHIRAGMTILINAAGSGAGSAGVQLARQLGATVFASAGSAEKLQLAARDGAVATVDYSAEDLTERVRQLSGGKGVDAVLDCVGGEVFEASLRALAWNGTLVTIGGHGGEAVRLDLIPFFRNQWSIIGSVNCTLRNIDEVLSMLESGKIAPNIHRTYPLEQAADAHSDLEARRHYGKLLLIP